MLREETSSRERVRRRKLVTSRTNQLDACCWSCASMASMASALPLVLKSQMPSSSSLVRAVRMASSSSRAICSGHQLAPATRMSSSELAVRDSGALTWKVAVRASRSKLTETYWYSYPESEVSRWSGVSWTPRASVGRSLLSASSRARLATVSLHWAGFTTSSTSFQSFARWPWTPSETVQKMSARSRRTLRLSVTRVSPPVPGRTPRSGTSGRDTAEERSSIRKISSQARASSYPPPAVVPLQAARNLREEWRLASSMPLRVSLVNLQKFTFQACELVPSM